jgi:hypothetical protein
MESDTTTRAPALQLELPLPTPEADRAGGTPPDWRLDEETRRIGRRGIAAARARLAGRPRGTDGSAHGRRRPGAGRAA